MRARHALAGALLAASLAGAPRLARAPAPEGAAPGASVSVPAAAPGASLSAPATGPGAAGLPSDAHPTAPSRDGSGRPAGDEVRYDGRFTFLRLRYGAEGRGMRGFDGFGRGRGREEPWAHDYIRGAERHFAKILGEVTSMAPRLEGKVLTLDDPELYRYPVAYIVEVGYWRPSDAEVEALRDYLLKGGFLIVDDFRGRDIWNFEEQLGRVLPGARLIPLEATHEIFDAFFHIPDPSALAPSTYQQYVPLYLGVFEDNDPAGRLMAVVNYNQDLAEYWEYSDMGYYPIDLTNEAYKFGVNYVVYAMTH